MDRHVLNDLDRTNDSKLVIQESESIDAFGAGVFAVLLLLALIGFMYDDFANDIRDFHQLNYSGWARILCALFFLICTFPGLIQLRLQYLFGDCTVKLKSEPVVGEQMEGVLQLSDNRKRLESIEAILICRKAFRIWLPLPMLYRFGWTLKLNRAIWCSNKIFLTLDESSLTRANFRFTVPGHLPASSTLDDEPTEETFWTLNFYLKYGLFRSSTRFTVPVLKAMTTAAGTDRSI